MARSGKKARKMISSRALLKYTLVVAAGSSVDGFGAMTETVDYKHSLYPFSTGGKVR